MALLSTTLLLSLSFLVNERATKALRTQVGSSVEGTASLTALFLDEQVRGLRQIVRSYAQRRPLLDARQQAGGPNRQELDRQLRELRESRSDVINVAGLADADGIMLASPYAPEVVGRDFSSRDWFRGVTRTGRDYVSKAFAGASAGNPLTISIAAPVRDDGGRVVAIVIASYTISDFQAYVVRFAALRGENITVTDQDGVVIARAGPPPTTLESMRGDPRIAAALAGHAGVDLPRQGGTDDAAVAAHAPVPELGWAVLVEVPTERAYDAVQGLHVDVLSITVPLAVVLLFGAMLLALTLRSRDANRAEALRQTSINRAVLDATTDAMLLADPAGRPVLRNAVADRVGDQLGAQEVDDVYVEAARLRMAVLDPDAFHAAAEAMRADPDLEVRHEFTMAETGRSFHLFSTPVRDTGGATLGRLFTARETTSETRARNAERLAETAAVTEEIEARERASLAEAVHDDSLQLVVAALLRIDSLQSRIAVAEAESLEQIAALLEQAIERLRQLIAALAPPDLDRGLGPALQQLTDGLFHGTATTVDITGPARPPLSEAASTAAFRILREALVNVRKHARAANVRIGIVVAEDRVVLTVRDDGVGSDGYTPAPGHLGVESMRRRAAAESGELSIDGGEGHGTSVTLTLPAERDGT